MPGLVPRLNPHKYKACMQSLKFMREVILRMRKTPCEHVLALFTNTNTGDKVGKPYGLLAWIFSTLRHVQVAKVMSAVSGLLLQGVEDGESEGNSSRDEIPLLPFVQETR